MNIYVAYKVLPAQRPTVASGHRCKWQPVFACSNERVAYWVGRLLGASRFILETRIATEHVDDDEFITMKGPGNIPILHKL